MIKNYLFFITITTVLAFGFAGCKGKSGSSKKGGVIDDGQVHGIAPSAKMSMTMPLGMVYVPPGTFHMGPSDEDINYTFTSRNREVSIPGFWMDATELTNNKYRQFVNWVRDSCVAVMLGAPYYDTSVHWNQIKNIKYEDPKFRDQLAGAGYFIKVDAQSTKPFFNPEKLIYFYSQMKPEAAYAENREAFKKNPLSFVDPHKVAIYPDTTVWMNSFAYSYNEPMTKRYFAHPSFGNYPVVGVNWKQAVAFCNWRTKYLNTYLEKKKMAVESDFRLPSEAEWEYAARGGRSNSMYPWGNYYLRNKKGCLLANFKPGRGNYAEDGGFYTVRVDAYWPNGFGLFNMAGNVAEWTGSYFNESSYNFMHDMSPDVRYDAKDSDPPRMKRKVVRGGSWKDVGFYLQTSTRSYEYQDTAKSYIGFRCVIDLVPRGR
ncbi:SUMF1/EgtB/PvdO family nonheme iron enzyme [Parasediminibacterium sp. JCM 36343]|uniref:type IX secretion system lipoprotein PorK/GldK n=1 Tax=Parasediminibacterium sp. JCM 36343 TaxID=3374279 RepID=UPI00397A56B1